MPLRLLFILTATLLALTSNANARPILYARPIGQWTWVPADERVSSQINTGVINGRTQTVRNYTLSSNALGAGLSAGLVLGKNDSMEIGIEASFSQFNGTYMVTDLMASNTATGSTYSCTYKVTNVLAAFRHYLGRKESKFRPYYGLTLGETRLQYPNLFSTHSQSDDSDQRSVTSGLGVGMTYKVTERIQLEAGYRYSLAATLSLNGLSDLMGKSQALSFSLRYNF
ncbi:MAG: outer membrane beta-barrel protein [Nibricoccus sp.]